MRNRLLVCVLITLTATWLAAPASAAGVDRLRDRTRDAAAAVDIKRVDAQWTNKLFSTTVRVRNLKVTGKVRVGMWYEGEMYHALVRRKASGTSKKIIALWPDEPGSLGRWACSQMKVAWKPARDLVRITVPAPECLGGGWFYGISGVWVTRGERIDKVGRMPFCSESC
jgi:hypothetical protein